MSDRKWARLETEATKTLVNVVWRQWRALGGGASGRPAGGLIDPEVLVLGSLYLTEAEPRLWTVMTDWLVEGSRFLSVQRLRNLRTAFPRAKGRVADLARFVATEARDARWRVLIEDAAPTRRILRSESTLRRRSSELVLDTPAALILRCRAAFGVGLKADLLAFLLGQRYRTTVATAAHALGYSTSHAFRGLQDLCVARLVHVTDIPAATEYSLPFDQWSRLFGLNDVPDWRPWKETIAYAVRLREWLSERASRPLADYAAAVDLRDLAERWRDESVRAGAAATLPTAPDGSEIEAWREYTRKILSTITAWT